MWRSLNPTSMDQVNFLKFFNCYIYTIKHEKGKKNYNNTDLLKPIKYQFDLGSIFVTPAQGPVHFFFLVQKEGRAQEKRNYEIRWTFLGMQAPEISSNMSF